MTFKPVKLAPALIAAGVILLVCILRLIQPDFFERLECMTYDMRVREAFKFPQPVTTNLGFVDINDHSIAFVQTNDSLGYRFGLYWPRQVYGRVVEELAAQGANTVAFDVIFAGLRPDQASVLMGNNSFMESDDFFGLQMRLASNVVLGTSKDVSLPPVFATNALALGDITTDKDSDGILRRARAFREYRKWHWALRQVAADPDIGIDLSKAKIEPRQIVFPRAGGDPIVLPLDADGNFDLTDVGGDNLPPGVPRHAKPFTDERIWHLGITLAAQELGLDLSHADVDLAAGRIILRGKGGLTRVIPVDHNGYFYINWCMTANDPHLAREPIENLLSEDHQRLEGATNLPDNWKGKLAVVGSSATGNDLTDRGATPLERDTLLATEHWNIANSLITNRFVRRSSIGVDLFLIVVMGLLAAVITWQTRALVAPLLVLALMVAYSGLSIWLFVQNRYWMPLIFPLGGALLMTHASLLTWRVVFEQAERRRVRSIFSRIVSPDIVHELLSSEKLSLGGARCEVTVLFADVRGFTELTDKHQEAAATYIAEHQLSGAAAKAYLDEQARETLSTVNTYLALVADMVKKHSGTLDKYIGDCVMAFWGAPTPNSKHASDCIRAAIDAQRAIHDLNLRRSEENQSREVENRARVSAGLPPKPMLPILQLGSGINTGWVTVGLMGSEAHISNYTVFGREVNLASRLESLSGRGRILISEETFKNLQQTDSALAATCAALPDANLKGIRLAVKVYEVPWKVAREPATEVSAPIELPLAET